MRANNRLNLLGQTFGDLIVIEESEVKNQQSQWLCQCTCGNKKIIRGPSLTQGNSTSCGRCGKYAHNRRGYEEISGAYWTHIKHNCKLRNTILYITEQEAWDVFLKQSRKCAISGIDLHFARNYMKNNKLQTASLDRIDSDGEYVIGNVQWVHKIVNIMKNVLSDGEFINWCVVIAEYNRNK